MTGSTTIVPPGGKDASLVMSAAPAPSAGVRVAESLRPNPYCPFMSVGADPDARSHGPSLDQRCYATEPFTPISAQHQAVFCLGTMHTTCSRFQQRSRVSTVRPSRTTLVSILAAGAAFLAGAVITVFLVGNPLTVEPAPATQSAAASAIVPPAASAPAAPQAPTAAPSQPAASPTQAAAPPSTQTYAVQPGDNLTSIAARYGITVAQLKATNNLGSDVLQLGQQLRIPAASPTPVR